MIDSLDKTLQNPSVNWWVKAMLIYEFHEKNLKKHGHKDHRHDFGWSTSETAKALKISQSQIAKAIVVGRMLKKNENLKLKYKSIGTCYEQER